MQRGQVVCAVRCGGQGAWPQRTGPGVAIEKAKKASMNRWGRPRELTDYRGERVVLLPLGSVWLYCMLDTVESVRERVKSALVQQSLVLAANCCDLAREGAEREMDAIRTPADGDRMQGQSLLFTLHTPYSVRLPYLTICSRHLVCRPRQRKWKQTDYHLSLA